MQVWVCGGWWGRGYAGLMSGVSLCRAKCSRRRVQAVGVSIAGYFLKHLRLHQENSICHIPHWRYACYKVLRQQNKPLTPPCCPAFVCLPLVPFPPPHRELSAPLLPRPPLAPPPPPRPSEGLALPPQLPPAPPRPSAPPAAYSALLPRLPPPGLAQQLLLQVLLGPLGVGAGRLGRLPARRP
jgi:hypothetical protein